MMTEPVTRGQRQEAMVRMVDHMKGCGWCSSCMTIKPCSNPEYEAVTIKTEGLCRVGKTLMSDACGCEIV